MLWQMYYSLVPTLLTLIAVRFDHRSRHQSHYNRVRNNAFSPWDGHDSYSEILGKGSAWIFYGTSQGGGFVLRGRWEDDFLLVYHVFFHRFYFVLGVV
jgi:hypothetical protein